MRYRVQTKATPPPPPGAAGKPPGGGGAPPPTPQEPDPQDVTGQDEVEHEWAGDLIEDGSESDPMEAFARFTGTQGEESWLDRADDGTLTAWVRDADGSVYRYSDPDAWAVDVDDALMTRQDSADEVPDEDAEGEGDEDLAAAEDDGADPFGDADDEDDEDQDTDADEDPDDEDLAVEDDDATEGDAIPETDDEDDPTEDDEDDEDDLPDLFAGLQKKAHLAGARHQLVVRLKA